MSKKKTQLDLLQEIADLLLPISNKARYDIGNINAKIAKSQSKEQNALETPVKTESFL